MKFKSTLLWLFVASLTTGALLISEKNQILMAGDVIDLRNSIYYSKNDGIPKRIITDGKRYISLPRPQSAYPRAGAAYGTYGGSPLSSELNDASQNIIFNPLFKDDLKTDYYSGSDQIVEMYSYYINLK